MRLMGIDRPTRDLDLWIARDRTNTEAMTSFLQEFPNRPPLERLQQPNFKFCVGDPVLPEVDILTSVAGDPEFDDCLSRSQQATLDGYLLQVVAVSDLLAIKRASANAMKQDSENATFSLEDRALAAGTAAKERRDIALLALLLAAGG
ncbi:hypothetical protein [Paucibacter sp. KBW04]|uniref:hypothetical protein n=1 Tax=Paucibacter sp. KBW04 TaxID=2153361 RepID=UPI0011CFC537|nr:hypothetical protein [Paucibacter sp. KBW04]